MEVRMSCLLVSNGTMLPILAVVDLVAHMKTVTSV